MNDDLTSIKLKIQNINDEITNLKNYNANINNNIQSDTLENYNLSIKNNLQIFQNNIDDINIKIESLEKK